MGVTRSFLYGIGLIALAVFLYFQTLQGGKVLFEGDIDPMIYPRVILVILGVMGAVCAIQGLFSRERQATVPIFTVRTVSMAVILILYAALFRYLGFALTSFLGGCGVAIVMGWRKPLSLILTIGLAVVAIWLLFNHGLHILLPEGTLFW